MATACRCTLFSGGGHGAPHLHVARMPTACRCTYFGDGGHSGIARPACIRLHPLRRRWAQSAPHACCLHAAAPPSAAVDTCMPPARRLHALPECRRAFCVGGGHSVPSCMQPACRLHAACMQPACRCTRSVALDTAHPLIYLEPN